MPRGEDSDGPSVASPHEVPEESVIKRRRIVNGQTRRCTEARPVHERDLKRTSQRVAPVSLCAETAPQSPPVATPAARPPGEGSRSANASAGLGWRVSSRWHHGDPVNRPVLGPAQGAPGRWTGNEGSFCHLLGSGVVVNAQQLNPQESPVVMRTGASKPRNSTMRCRCASVGRFWFFSHCSIEESVTPSPSI